MRIIQQEKQKDIRKVHQWEINAREIFFFL